MTSSPPAPSTRIEQSHKFVFDVSEGYKSQRDLLGGKGANLAEMMKRRWSAMTTVDDVLDGLPTGGASDTALIAMERASEQVR